MRKTENSYSALGRWFEYLNGDCDYEKWSQYLIKLLKERGAGKTGLDVGCGNGYFTRALIRAGYTVTGVDISPQMLDTAQKISLSEGVRAEFILGDIAKLKSQSKVDFCIAVNDCINYVPADRLNNAFSHVFACLKRGGVFIFDISTPRKLKNTIGNNLFAEDGDELTYLWFNTLKDDRVEMDFTLFEREKDGKYSRYDEKHIQYIHEEDTILSALSRAGFEGYSEGHLGLDKGDRITFIGVKK